MSIFTPLWWSTISASTLIPASTHGSLVTASPSTTSSVESATASPTLPVGILSTSTMSPTATLCWRPPLRTIAYTLNSLSRSIGPLMPAFPFRAAREASPLGRGGRREEVAQELGAETPKVKTTYRLRPGQIPPGPPKDPHYHERVPYRRHRYRGGCQIGARGTALPATTRARVATA